MNESAPRWQTLLQQAQQQHQTGQLDAAERLYRQILKEEPQQPHAMHMLGVLEHQRGRSRQGVELIEQSIQLAPGEARFYNNLAAIRLALGDAPAAQQACRQALRHNDKLHDAWCNLGAACERAGDLAEAERSYQQALALQPGYAEAHRNLGLLEVRTGRTTSGADHLREAVRINPRDVDAWCHLGSVLTQVGQWPDALTCFDRAVRQNPNHAEAWRLRGRLLLMWGQRTKQDKLLQGSVQSYERHLQLQPTNIGAKGALGVALQEVRRFDDARKCLREVLEHPQATVADKASAHNNLAGISREHGKIDDAVNHLEQAVELHPEDGAAYSNLAALRKFSEKDSRMMARLEKHVQQTRQPPQVRSRMHFALGKMHDDCGNPDQAFQHFREANDLAGVKYRPAVEEARMDAMIETFTAERMAQLRRQGVDSELPIFIVGMPRSGTTLVEQILASHPDVYGAGELSLIAHASAQLGANLPGQPPYPQSVLEASTEQLQQTAQSYLARLRSFDPQAKRVTDKMPTNFINLGFIATLFPQARIIHCHRNALDVCVSCYFQPFAQPLSFAYSLDALGHYYRQYERMMEHWQSVLGDQIVNVQYEELVENSEDVTRALIAACGLPWNDDCLEHHKTRRSVRTASSYQVRQPIYRTAIARWERYARHLKPLRNALESEQR